MGKIFVDNFSAGWIPSDDLATKRPGQLRMQNLCLDSKGALTSRPSPSVIAPPSLSSINNWVNPTVNPIINYFETLVLIAGVVTKYRFVQNSLGDIYLVGVPKNTGRDIVNGSWSGPFNPIPITYKPSPIGEGMGNVFIGGKPAELLRANFSLGSGGVWKWGIPKATTPLNVLGGPSQFIRVDPYKGAFVALSTNFASAAAGAGTTVTPGSFGGANDLTITLAGAAGSFSQSGSVDLNTLTFVEGSSPLNGTTTLGAAGDIFYFPVAMQGPPGESSNITLTINTAGGSFSFTWTVQLDNPSINYKTLSCLRSQFGISGNADWSTVTSYGVTITSSATGANSYILYQFNPIVPAFGARYLFGFVGGVKAQITSFVDGINNPYEYVVRVGYTVGDFTALSVINDTSVVLPVGGPFSGTISVAQLGYAALKTPVSAVAAGLDPQVNTFWFYKRGGTLEQWFLIGIVGLNQTIFDSEPDSTYQSLNQTYDEALVSIGSLPGTILDFIGPVNGRMLLMTEDSVYFSDVLNPDVINANMTIKPNLIGLAKNLFIVKATNEIVLLGTSTEVYEISGSFALQTDGTYDIRLTHLGLFSNPPVSTAHCIYNSTLYYHAKDGIRAVYGSNSDIISGELVALFRQQDRFNAPHFTNIGMGQSIAKLFAGKQKIIFLAEIEGGPATNHYGFYEFDLVTKSWTERLMPAGYDPIGFFSDDDGFIISVHEDGKVRYYELPTNAIMDSGVIGALGLSPPVYYESPVIDNGLPNIIKELETLILHVDTNGGFFGANPGSIFNAYLINQRGDETGVGQVQTEGLKELSFPCHGISIDKSKGYGLKLTNVNNSCYLRLVDWSLTYVDYAEPQVYSKILPNNLGFPGRKRIKQYSAVFDTRGLPITITVYVDGVSKGDKQFTSSGKSSFVYAFESETIGFDIWHTAAATQIGIVFTPFEDWGINLTDCISEKMPALCNYLKIPNTNFGKTSPKKISSLSFVIDTFGNDVTFTPILDGASGSAQTFNTNVKTTVQYYFTTGQFATDFGGVLRTTGSPHAPSGPMQGILDEPGGTLQPLFEVYTSDSGEIFMQPDELEILPENRVFDLIGPFVFDRRAKILSIRLRAIATTTTLTYNIICDEVTVFSGTFATTANVDTTYQNMRLPKSIIGNIVRVEVSSPDITKPFNRWNCKLLVSTSGMDSDNRWVSPAGDE